ncbi:MAG: hypothetical protein LBE57_01285 [Methanosarcinales archaeon]|nr:hypothetical protein [Methanosarcinales archaeon]
MVTCGTAAAADTIYVNESLFIHIGDGSLGLPDAQGTSVNWTLDATYILVENINVANITADWTPVGGSSGSFTGTLNGQNFTISNLTILAGGNASLFNRTDGATIENVILNNVSSPTVGTTGASLIATANNTTIENCHASSVNIVGNYSTGGLVGHLSGSTISNSSASGTVTGQSPGWGIGGLVGTADQNSVIENSFAMVTVTGTGGETNGNIGGFIGGLSNSTISNCYATGNVVGNAGSNNTGSFVGFIGDTIWAASNVDNSIISYCYAVGSVSGAQNVGGFAGNISDQHINIGNAIQFSFFREGNGGTVNGFAIPESAANLMKIQTFLNAGWDISPVPPDSSKIWYIVEGVSYPTFYWVPLPDIIYVNELLFIHIGDGSANLPDARGNSVNWTLNATYILEGNVNMANVNGGVFTPIGSQTNPFTGTLDGQNFTISNLSISASSHAGLFSVTNGATIENVILNNVTNPTSGAYSGSLVGAANNTVIENCHALSVSVSGNYSIGGLVGSLNGSAVSNSSASGTVRGSSPGSGVGGLAGSAEQDSVITTSFAAVAVTAESGNIGGFIGGLSNSTISNCYAEGNVVGNTSSNNTGGFVGYIGGVWWPSNNDDTSTISNCYAVGDVFGDYSVGGGYGAQNVGGFAGNVSSQHVDIADAIQFSFFREDNGGDLNGFAIPKSAEDLMKIQTFLDVGWSISSAPDSSKIWYIVEGAEYPKFYWTYVPSGGGSGGGGSGTGNATVIPPGNNSTGNGTPPGNNSTGNGTPPGNNSTGNGTPPGNNSTGGGSPGGEGSWKWYYTLLVAGSLLGIFFLIFFYRRREDEEEEQMN